MNIIKIDGYTLRYTVFIFYKNIDNSAIYVKIKEKGVIMKKNKLSIALTIVKYILLVLTVLAFAYFISVLIIAKRDYVNAGEQGFQGLGYGIGKALVIVLGVIVNGILAVVSLAFVVTSSISKANVKNNKKGLYSEEERSKLVLRRKKDQLHFILLTIFPIVAYLIILIVTLTMG